MLWYQATPQTWIKSSHTYTLQLFGMAFSFKCFSHENNFYIFLPDLDENEYFIITRCHRPLRWLIKLKQILLDDLYNTIEWYFSLNTYSLGPDEEEGKCWYRMDLPLKKSWGPFHILRHTQCNKVFFLLLKHIVFVSSPFYPSFRFYIFMVPMNEGKFVAVL